MSDRSGVQELIDQLMQQNALLKAMLESRDNEIAKLKRTTMSL